MTRRRRGLLVILLALGSFTAPAPLRAERRRSSNQLGVPPGEDATAAPIGSTPAVLTLIVNTVPRGDVFVLLDGVDVLMARQDLIAAGLTLPAGMAEVELVSLLALAPGFTFVLDEDATALRLDVEATALPTTMVDLGAGARPGDLELGTDTSLFINYAAHLDDDRRADGFAEAGLTAHGVFAYSSVNAPSVGSPARGLSYLRWDDQDHLRRYVAGDAFTPGVQLGGGLVVGGLHVARDFNLDPYFVVAPGLELAGEALVPSTVEVYVDGVLVHRESVAPGPIQIANVTGLDGAGDTRVVVRDAFGQEREITGTYYQAQGLLAPGLDEYDYAAGFRREQVGVESFDYREPVVVGRHRRGLTRTFTGSAWQQASAHLGAGGFGASIGLPVGQLELSGAASVEDGATGGAAALAYAYRGRRVGVACTLRAQSDQFATLDVGAAADRPRFDATAAFGAPLGRRASLSIQLAASEWRDRGHRERGLVAATWHGGERWFVTSSLSADRTETTPPSAQVFVGMTMVLGRRTVGSAGYRAEGAADGRGTLAVHHGAPAGRGVGYRASIRGGGGTAGAAAVDLQGDHGIYSARVDATPDGSSGSVGIAGGLVFIAGRAIATRPVQQGFALVRVPGVAGVRAYLNNHEIGRTDDFGDVVVSSLLPYYGNRLSVNDLDLPFDRAAPLLERTIAPPYRGGVVVRFWAPPLQVVRGRLVVDVGGIATVPAYGELTVTDGALSSPIGRDGEFELDGLGAGPHEVVIEWSGGTCTSLLDTPARALGIVELGELRCAQ